MRRMLKERVDTIKNALVKVEKNNSKKSMENLISIAVILVVTIIAINYIWKGDTKKVKNNTEGKDEIQSNVQDSEKDKMGNDNLEERLADILSKITGVGEVKVLLTYAQTKQINPVYNEDEQSSITEETDTSGGKRTISSSNNKKEVVYSNNNIITQSISSPQIQGAVIIARGAGDVKVKTDIIQAVSAATGLSTYKIQVFDMN